MDLHNESAAPDCNRGGAVVSKAVVAKNYHNAAANGSGIEYAVAELTRRFHLRMETARVICRLSGLGGAHG